MVWQPFIARELNKNEVRAVVAAGYRQCSGRLKVLSQQWGVEAADFKKFIAVLHKYRLHPAPRKPY